MRQDIKNEIRDIACEATPTPPIPLPTFPRAVAKPDFGHPFETVRFPGGKSNPQAPSYVRP